MLNTILSIPTYSEPSTAMVVLWIIFIAILGITILGALIIGIYGFVDDDDELKGFLLGAFMLGGVILLPIWALTSTIDSNKQYPAWYESEIEEIQYDHIYSLKLNNEVSGHFFLGSGKVGTDSYYYFYIKNSHDAYQLTKVKADGNVYLKESNETPKVVDRKDAKSTEIYTLIYVPVGTVVTADFSAT